MPFRIITIPFDADKEFFSEDPLNKFCLNKKISSYSAEFFRTDGRAYWTVFIEYEIPLEDAGKPTDLNEPERLMFQRLREWRRQKAEGQGVPVFIIATNAILKDIAVKNPQSIEALKEIKCSSPGTS